MPEKQLFLEKYNDKIENVIDKKMRLYFDVKPEYLQEIVEYLFKGIGCRLSTGTAQESYHHVEVQYHFSHDETGQYFCPRIVMKDKKNPVTESITPIVKGAEWIEREMMDFWGVTFTNHPKPEPLLINEHPNFEKRKNQFRFNGVNHE